METMDSCENVGPLDVSIKKENTQDEGIVKPKMDVDKYCAQFNNNGQVVEALKARIRELESVSKTGSDKFICLLCKVSIYSPAVGTDEILLFATPRPILRWYDIRYPCREYFFLF